MPAQESTLPPPPPKKQGILAFGRNEQQAPEISNVNSDVNTLSRRLRLLEEGFTNLRRFFQVTEENIIAKNRYNSAELKTITSDINEIRKEIQELRDKLSMVIRELQAMARKEDVKVLEKYINLWNPVKFVTQNEIEQIINEVLEKKQQ